MHDLRTDPNAHAVDERTRYDLPTVTTVTTPTATVPAHVLTPAQLRTVPAPDLRNGIPGARPLSDWGLRIDARPVTAQIDALTHDCRTADDKLRAELVRLVDALQALTLRVELLEGAIAAGRAGVTA